MQQLIKEVICEASCCPSAQTQPLDIDTEAKQGAQEAGGDGVWDEQFLQSENENFVMVHNMTHLKHLPRL